MNHFLFSRNSEGYAQEFLRNIEEMCRNDTHKQYVENIRLEIFKKIIHTVFLTK